jgi:hypothetical protein
MLSYKSHNNVKYIKLNFNLIAFVKKNRWIANNYLNIIIDKHCQKNNSTWLNKWYHRQIRKLANDSRSRRLFVRVCSFQSQLTSYIFWIDLIVRRCLSNDQFLITFLIWTIFVNVTSTSSLFFFCFFYLEHNINVFCFFWCLYCWYNLYHARKY